MKSLLTSGKTLAEVGFKYGVTGERIRQLTGGPNLLRQPVNRNPSTGIQEVNRRSVVELFQQGLNDTDIAAALNLSAGYVVNLRSKSGALRTYRQSTSHSLWCLARWIEEYEYVPAATDWSPALARKLGHLKRVERFEDFRKRYGCPMLTSVQTQFGSWSNFIRAGGHKPWSTRKVPWDKA